jgi:AcrR family transcriptional regulator
VARHRDEGKREAVLAASKSLFARKGYHATSISDIRRETGLSTGTIYNYFRSKEDIVETIIEEGWQEMLEDISGLGQRSGGLAELADYLAFTVMPRLLRDEDLIHILLSEAVELSGISEKLQLLVDMVLKLRGANDDARISALPREQRVKLQTAITVYFLGILEAIRISRRTDLGIHQEDILQFIRDMIIRDLSPSSRDAK